MGARIWERAGTISVQRAWPLATKAGKILPSNWSGRGYIEEADMLQQVPDRAAPLVSVVIPVYNERATIGEILRRVGALEIDKEVIVIDDGSTDGTRELLTTLDQTVRFRVLFQERNCGKGVALRRGFRAARGAVVIVQDADLEYDPQDYPRLLEPLLRGEADVVYGVRPLHDPAHRLSLWQYAGNKMLTTLLNTLTRTRLSDVYVGYKVFARAVLEQMALVEDRFGFEIEVTARVALAGWRIREVPIAYYPRTYREGKKIAWRDVLHGFRCVLRYGLVTTPQAAVRGVPSTEVAASVSSDGEA